MKKNLMCHRVEILKPVQHDKSGRHPEFISGSKIRPQVQHDESFSLFAKLWSRKIFVRTRPQLKTQFAFGRSMIEMLGVLAIIGVLSIGGLYAYKQAMMRYRLNQMQDWFSRMRFAIAVNCDDDDGTKCGFGNYSTEAYSKRHSMLCAELGEDFCSKAAGLKMNIPFISNVFWQVGLPSASIQYFVVYFTDLNKEYCEAFIQRDWANLYLIQDYATTFYQRVSAKGKPLTQEQKDLLKAHCPFSSYFQMNFYRHD